MNKKSQEDLKEKNLENECGVEALIVKIALWGGVYFYPYFKDLKYLTLREIKQLA